MLKEGEYFKRFNYKTFTKSFKKALQKKFKKALQKLINAL